METLTIILIVALSFSIICFIIVQLLKWKIKNIDKRIIELKKLEEQCDKELYDLYYKEKRNTENMKMLHEEMNK